jgi:hypothetical protein
VTADAARLMQQTLDKYFNKYLICLKKTVLAFTVSIVKMTDDYLKGSNLTCFKVLSQHSSEGSKERKTTSVRIIGVPAKISKLSSPKI